jgi:lipoprotein-anchoring transpeptidase ErfK/SrfK
VRLRAQRATRIIRSATAALVLVGVATAVPPAPASAQAEPETISLQASATKILIGESVTLSGALSPAAADRVVEIVDDTDSVVATATTDASGAFSTSIEPRGSRTYRARSDGSESDPVTVRVRAVVTASMTPVRLFDVVTVRGVVRPARPGRRVEVALSAGGRVVGTRRVAMGSAGGYSATFRVMSPGTYRARASFAGDDLLRGSDATEADATALPRLREGSSGVFVELLERRLLELHYRLVATKDGRYDARTADAVVAFHKLQRMDRSFSVDAATWRALADPVPARARRDWRGFHFEVDQTRQVLLAVEDGHVTNVLHVSSGKPSTPTRDGVWRVTRKIAGYSPNHLYYPSYFDGYRALHGWTEVPTYAASHGCVRIPYWNATWVFGLADLGTRVVVYH